MSKITLKNLSYDTTLPPFLARLQAANQGNDRHEFSVARPKKQRTAEDEAEDEPVYFDELSGDTLTKSEWESKDAEEKKYGEGDGAAEVKDGAESKVERKDEEGREREKEKVAGIGGARKRKAGKVVGGEEEDQETATATKTKEVKGETNITKSKVEAKKGDKPKPVKKAKKIKLSFDD